MAIPVGVADVERVLRPWLGTLFLSANPLAADVAAHMRAYAPGVPGQQPGLRL